MSTKKLGKGKKVMRGSASRDQIITEEKEKHWRIPPSDGIPKYNAEDDPYCPKGKLRKYNEGKRIKAKELAKQDRVTNKWIHSSLQPDHTDVSANVHSNPRMIGLGNAADNGNTDNLRTNYAEIEVLQKIVVRENLLAELHKLLKSQNDVSTCLSEVVELIKALRYQTVDIIEDINSWQQVQRTPKAFMFKGSNYLVKIKCDLDFLDFYDEVVERFCFEFKSNPLAYRGGGNIITGYDFNKKQFREGLMNSYYNSSDAEFLDGVETARLHNAEKIIQNEFNRLAKEKNNGKAGAADGAVDELADVLDRDLFNAMSSSLNSYEKEMAGGGTSDAEGGGAGFDISAAGEGKGGPNGQKRTAAGAQRGSTKGSKKSSGVAKRTKTGKKVFNPRKIKQERIATLSEEASELKAMMAHVEDKIDVLAEEQSEMLAKKELLESRMMEARQLGREVAAQHIAAEISVTIAAAQEHVAQVKELQREIYFLDLERKRKLGVMRKLKNELVEEKRRAQVQREIEKMIKEKGLSAALEAFHKQASTDLIDDLGEKNGVSMPLTEIPFPKSPSGTHRTGSRSPSRSNSPSRSPSRSGRFSPGKRIGSAEDGGGGRGLRPTASAASGEQDMEYAGSYEGKAGAYTADSDGAFAAQSWKEEKEEEEEEEEDGDGEDDDDEEEEEDDDDNEEEGGGEEEEPKVNARSYGDGAEPVAPPVAAPVNTSGDYEEPGSHSSEVAVGFDTLAGNVDESFDSDINVGAVQATTAGVDAIGLEDASRFPQYGLAAATSYPKDSAVENELSTDSMKGSQVRQDARTGSEAGGIRASNTEPSLSITPVFNGSGISTAADGGVDNDHGSTGSADVKVIKTGESPSTIAIGDDADADGAELGTPGTAGTQGSNISALTCSPSLMPEDRRNSSQYRSAVFSPEATTSDFSAAGTAGGQSRDLGNTSPLSPGYREGGDSNELYVSDDEHENSSQASDFTGPNSAKPGAGAGAAVGSGAAAAAAARARARAILDAPNSDQHIGTTGTDYAQDSRAYGGVEGGSGGHTGSHYAPYFGSSGDSHSVATNDDLDFPLDQLDNISHASYLSHGGTIAAGTSGGVAIASIGMNSRSNDQHGQKASDRVNPSGCEEFSSIDPCAQTDHSNKSDGDNFYETSPLSTIKSARGEAQHGRQEMLSPSTSGTPSSGGRQQPDSPGGETTASIPAGEFPAGSAYAAARSSRKAGAGSGSSGSHTPAAADTADDDDAPSSTDVPSVHQ